MPRCFLDEGLSEDRNTEMKRPPNRQDYDAGEGFCGTAVFWTEEVSALVLDRRLYVVLVRAVNGVVCLIIRFSGQVLAYDLCSGAGPNEPGDDNSCFRGRQSDPEQL